VEHLENPEVKESVMKKNLSFARSNRRDFLRMGLVGGTGLVVAQFAAPKELRAQSTQWSGQVSESSDDATEASSGTVFLTGTSINLCASSQKSGFRFQNVTVPNGATITAASISFYVTASAPDLTCTVYMDASDNAVTFTTTRYDISNITNTSNYATFTANGTGWTDSGDLSAAVQEVVNRAGWASGNAMAVKVVASTETGEVDVVTWDSTPSEAAILTIQYS
jgi:hypothetical protein